MTTPQGAAPATLEDFMITLRDFVAARDWSQFHDPKNLTMLICSEAGELAALYRWVSTAAAERHAQEPTMRARVAAEIGDVGIGLCLLCDRLGIDLVHAMKEKLAANEKKYPVATSRGHADRPVP